MTAPHPTRKSGPLAGVRVLDLTSVVLGPYATQMLGDLGADIIKIEAPEGDTTRYTGPRAQRRHGRRCSWGSTATSAASCSISSSAPARDALLRLVDTRRRVRPQHPAAEARASSGLAPDALLARSPRLIYAGIHGWREDGPYRGRPAYDDIIQGLCGVASLMDN